MLILIIVLIALAVVVLVSTGFVVTGRRRLRAQIGNKGALALY